jgi:uridine kinase
MSDRQTQAGSGSEAYVVAVSGTSGAGKTTLVDQVSALLANSTRLHFDDYVNLGNDIAVIQGWLAGGADPNELRTPEFAAALRRLRGGETLTLPNGRGTVAAAGIVMVEEPFGKSRLELAPLIDLAVHLEVPPDVALARRSLRLVEVEAAADPLQGLEAVAGQLRAYLAAGRDAYLAAARAARDSADLVLDGMLPTQELAAALVGEIRRRS